MSFYNIHKRSPFWYELDYSRTAYSYYWDTYNDFLRECNLPVNSSDRLRTKEDGVKLILDTYQKLGKVPSSLDIKGNRNWFTKHFGSWENALIESGLIKEKRQQLNKSEIIENTINCLIKLSEELKRFPTVKEFEQELKLRKKGTVLTRRNLCENLKMTFLQLCDEFLNFNLLENGYGNVCFNLNNKRCKSVDESIISNIFIKENFVFEYEPNYKDVIKTEECRYKFDWVLNLEDRNIYVEYFGLYYPKDKSKLIQEYISKSHRKIKLCKLNKVELLDIYPEDLSDNCLGLYEKLFELKLIQNPFSEAV